MAAIEYDLDLLTAEDLFGEGAVAQSLVLTQAVAAEMVYISPAIEYDLDLLTNYAEVAVSQSFTLTQAVSGTNWFTLASRDEGATSYTDTTMTPGVTYEYRVGNDTDGWVYSNSASIAVERDASVAQSMALTQSIGGNLLTAIRVLHSMVLSQSVNAVAYTDYADAAVSQAMTLTQEIEAYLAYRDVATAQALALTQAVSGVIAQGPPIMYGAVLHEMVLSQVVGAKLYELSDDLPYVWTKHAKPDKSTWTSRTATGVTWTKR